MEAIRMEEINIYCDESCHLEHDSSNAMVIGAISCDKDIASEINKRIKSIKQKHHVYKYAEIKWVKVSKSKIEMYKELIDLFFEYDNLLFKAVVASDKDKLVFGNDLPAYNDLYYRIYYLVLKEMLEVGFCYDIYIDIKDTRGSTKIESLKDVLNGTLYKFYDTTVNKIQLVRSDQIELMGLVDLLIGAVSYKNRELNNSQAKLELVRYIEQKINKPLNRTTPKYIKKFNIFQWRPLNAR